MLDDRIIDLRTYYNIPLHCPFCGTPSFKIEGGKPIELHCRHLLLWTHSEFTAFVSEQLDAEAEKRGFRIERDDDSCHLVPLSDEDSANDDEDLEFVELVERFTDVVIFRQIAGSPLLETVTIAFAYSEIEHEEFKSELYG